MCIDAETARLLLLAELVRYATILATGHIDPRLEPAAVKKIEECAHDLRVILETEQQEKEPS